jgi:nidogen (entactin)
LTFLNEFPEFLNIPFPIEYPSISPFYSNIDTSQADGSSKISYYQSTDSGVLNRAASNIRNAFSSAQNFRAKSILVVTWNNVPKWKGQSRERSYEKNTFQVAVISNDEESFVEFLYPQSGLQWVQAETGESGLPDIRARAGFIAADGRFVALKGSGSDKVRHLSETSNFGKPGRWLYRVGKLSEGENIQEPDNVPQQEENLMPSSCSSGGRLQCHSQATCEDNQEGFCCKCKEGFYGNGLSCIKNNVPLRVTGGITGHINSVNIQAQLQAYVVMVDGRAYTAISALNADSGPKVQLLEVIGGVIGWLFAKPVGSTLNGYQITGGKFNHTSNIRFQSGENLHITQRFVGLNLWDQLATEIEISGDVPEIHEGVKVTMEDFVEEYTSSGPNTIQAVTNHKIELSSGDPDIEYTAYQNVSHQRDMKI